MTSYSVTINCDPTWVSSFDANGYQLIMAKAVGTGNGNYVYNVVASTTVVGAIMEENWTDTYQLTGSKQTFQNGVTITSLTGPEDVIFGDTYFLNSFSDYNVAVDSNAPPNGFGFRNKIPCSAVLSLQVGNTFNPVFISPLEYPPGFATMIPIPKVCFWFQANLKTNTMITVDKSDVFEVDLTGSTSATINYDANGVWSRSSTSKPIDYTRTVPGKVGYD